MKADKYRDYMFNMTKKVIDEIGPRPPCSDAEKKLVSMLEDEWKPICDRVDIEEFSCSPYAFLGFLPFSVLLYIGAAVAYWYIPLLSFAIALLGGSMLLLEFGRYREFIDFLFPKANGLNIIGTIKPRGEVKQRVIVSGHMDSAYEFNLWYIFKNAAIPLMAIAFVAVLIMLGGSLAKTFAFYTGGADAPVFRIIGIITVVLAPFVSLFAVFHTYKPVPGAMDDMAGVAVTAAVGKYIADSKKEGANPFEKTEVVLIGMSSEEAGLRGAKRYVKKHRKEMKAIPTYGLFLDGICDERYLSVVRREICTGAKHDPALVKLALDAAEKRGFPISSSIIPIGGSDASPFSNGGVPSVCLLCQDTSRLVPNYHTRLDTCENIRPQSLSVALQLTLDMIERLDSKN